MKEKKGTLTFVPAGGLANRMLAVASAYTLARQTGIKLQVLWFQDWALSAPFRSIFEKPCGLSLRDATLADYLLYDRARKRNLWLPALPQRLLFERRIKEEHVDALKRQGFDFAQWATGHRCYMSCFSVFGLVPDAVYSQLFRPVREVMAVVDSYCSQFSAYTIGLHIRRTDHAQAIAQSPDELFLQKVEAAIEAHADTKVFLATDSTAVKHLLTSRFGSRIITPGQEARRDSTDGIRGGLADMYTLARTNIIYGSAGSTFSPMAARIGGNEIEILSRKTS